MPKRNERTSKRVAKIAGEILAWRGRAGMTVCLVDDVTQRDEFTLIKWSDIRTLAASALTQTADKKPRGRPAGGGGGSYIARPRSRRRVFAVKVGVDKRGQQTFTSVKVPKRKRRAHKG